MKLAKLHLIIGNVWTEAVRDKGGDVDVWLHKYLSIQNKAAQYQESAFTIPLSLMIGNSFLSGLATDVVLAGRKAGHTVTWESRRQKAFGCQDVKAFCLPDYLRDYQRAAVEAVHKRTRGVVWIPTGGGKTVVAAGIIQSVPCRWLFLAHRQELVEQMAERYSEFSGEKCGIIGSGRWDESHRVTAATYQTLHRAEGKAETLLRDVGGIIGDEIHTVAADTFMGVFRASTAYYRVGLSASPVGRADGRDRVVTGVTGPVIAKVGADKLVAEGRLAKPRIRFINCVQPYKMVFQKTQAARAKEWREAEKALITESTVRNDIVVEITKIAQKPCLIFVSKIAHGKSLADKMNKIGIKAAYAHGGKNAKARRAILDSVRDESTDVVIATSVWDEGVDMPGLRTVIMAGGGKSPIKAVQRVGRALRVSEGKSTADIFDIMDRGNATLTKHSSARLKALEASGFEISVCDLGDLL